MKSKKLQKVLGMLLSMGMLVPLITGCGGQDSGQNTGGTAAQGTGQNQESEPPFSVSVMLEDYSGAPLSGEYGDQVMAKLEEYTNCDIEFMWVPADGYEEKIGITLAQGEDMPMIMAVDMSANVIAAAKAGAFWDLTDFISDSEALPNLSQANENVNKAFTIDGKLIGVYRSRPLGRNGWGYRQDWADALNLDEPKTIEEFYNMLYQFTYGDPDGNGKDDTYGLCLCKYWGPFDIMQTWFGCGNGWVEQDGELVPVHQTPEYMEALQWFRKIYEDGLVYSDFAVRDISTWKDGVQNGECGVFVDIIGNSKDIWDYFVNNEVPAVTGDGLASMHLMVGLAKDENSEIKNLATTGHSGCLVITKAAKTEEDVMKCLQFLDKLNDDEMHVMMDCGLEGIHWNWQDGYVTQVDMSDMNLMRSINGLSQLGNILYDEANFESPIGFPEREVLKIEKQKEAAQYVVYNPAIGYLANSETYAISGATLDDILIEARTKYIVGQLDESGLKKAWENWLVQGGSAVMEEVNAQFHADGN